MSSASAVRRLRSALGTPLTFRPYSTFCATVMCGNRAYSWKTVFTSRWRAGNAVTSTPPSLITPAVGCSKPAIIRNTVVLPEPDGPQDREQFTVCDGQVGALDRHDVAEHLAHTDQLDLRIVNGGSDIRVRL